MSEARINSQKSQIPENGVSAWSPLRIKLFRALWIASVVSNIGTWIQNVGAAWLMAELTASPTMVALIQTAASLPIFLLALPAGALADIVDKRRLLVWTQIWLIATGAALGFLTLFGAMNGSLLLAFTFLIGLGTALTIPALQAVTPEIVPRSELAPAVALSSMSVNVARAAGPALGGVIVASAGASAAFFLNAASFVALLLVMQSWRRESAEPDLPPEHFFGALRNAVRYARNAPPLKAVLVRTAAFIFGGSALWALLPVLAQNELKFSALGYGALLGAIGVGALAGAAVLPKFRARFSVETIVGAACVLFGAATVLLAYFADFYLLALILLVGGVAWVALMSSFNVAAQQAVPAWVKARAIAFYLLVFQGVTALGSFLWGAIAENFGLRASLVAAGITLAASVLFAVRYRLPAEKLDLSPTKHWQQPETADEIAAGNGLAMITVEYRVRSENAAEFQRAAQNLKKIRLRDGATFWLLMRDAADATRFVEFFTAENWTEHLRQHERFSAADLEIENLVRRFHDGDKPRVTHYVSR